jgi:lysozyme
MNEEKLTALVKKHEGLRLRAYQDSVGVWTIGYGTNLQSLVIDEPMAAKFLDLGIFSAKIAAKMFPEWAFLDTDARQNAFIDMVYNIGPNRLAFFKKMLEAIRRQDWNTVAKEMLDSKWATQVGQRALTLIAMMQTGNFPQE